MKLWARQPILSATACFALLGAGSSTPSLLARQLPDAVAPVFRSAAPTPDGEGQRWLKATLAALDEPTEVRMPFADDFVELDAGHVAVAYAFQGLSGQPLEIKLRRDPSSSGPI